MDVLSQALRYVGDHWQGILIILGLLLIVVVRRFLRRRRLRRLYSGLTPTRLRAAIIDPPAGSFRCFECGNIKPDSELGGNLEDEEGGDPFPICKECWKP